MDINQVLKQTIKMIQSFDHPITIEELKFYGLNNFIKNIRETYDSNVAVLFDFGRYSYEPEYKNLGVIKVSYEVLWYFFEGGNIRFSTDSTEEEIFQNSTVQNYYDLEPDIAVNIKKLISLLEHIWKKK